jgi:transposase-like protein
MTTETKVKVVCPLCKGETEDLGLRPEYVCKNCGAWMRYHPSEGQLEVSFDCKTLQPYRPNPEMIAELRDHEKRKVHCPKCKGMRLDWMGEYTDDPDERARAEFHCLDCGANFTWH